MVNLKWLSKFFLKKMTGKAWKTFSEIAFLTNHFVIEYLRLSLSKVSKITTFSEDFGFLDQQAYFDRL